MVNAFFDLAGERLEARLSGALHWPRRRMLVVGDLHLGVSARQARRGVALLPPYEGADTLARLAAEIRVLDPAHILCLGDSFDDPCAAAAPGDDAAATLAGLADGRRWEWIAGNHDPRPPAGTLPGCWAEEAEHGPLAFRHIALATTLAPGRAEVSAHFHPKARLIRAGRLVSRRCFVVGTGRVVLPAFGTYTGGLDAADRALDPFFDASARVLMLGRTVTPVLRSRLGAERVGA